MSEEMNMNEENWKQNTPQLREAALEGVSGGDSPTPAEAARANTCCSICPRKGGKCGHKMRELAEYIHEHGDILSYQNCPYYKI